MREPLMQGSPSGAISVDWRPDHRALPRARALAAGVLAAAALVVAVALVAESIAPSQGLRAPLRGRMVHGLSGLPTGAALAVARSLGADDRAFWVRPGVGALVARSRPAGISARFTRSRVAVRTAHGTLGLSLVAADLGGVLRAVGKATPVAHSNRVFYARGGLSEWYANGPLGLEQGLTIARAPMAARSRTLSFAFAISGTLEPRLQAGALTFRDRAGGVALRYSDLSVTDARGHLLPAGIVLRRGRLILRVDAAGARYPIKIDPLLTPASGDGISSAFGYSVAVSGTTVVVGAPSEGTTSTAEGAGAAYVFVEPASGWQDATQNAMLTASDGVSGDQFGLKVDVASTSLGTTAFVGAPYHSSSNGAVYVFSEPAAGWGTGTSLHETAELAPTSNGSQVGYAFAVTSSPTTGLSTAVVGAPAANSYAGAAYVFAQSASGWSSTPTATLAAPGSAGLGNAVAITTSLATDRATAVVGAPTTSSSAGAVYVFVEPAAGWPGAKLTSTLTATGAAPFARLGTSVAIATTASDATTVVAGAPSDTVSGITSGSAYVFVGPAGGAWGASGTQAAELTSSAPAANEYFGGSVAATSTAVFVADTGVANSSGSGSTAGVWEFGEPGAGWANAAQAASLTYTGDSSYSDALLAVEGDPTVFLGQPGNGDVAVICSFGGACPPIPPTSRASKVTAACGAQTASRQYPCAALVADASGQLPAQTATGALTFKASSGTFVGSSACTLTPAAGSGGLASCGLTYMPSATSSPGGATVLITASYAGDPKFAAGSAAYQLTIPKTCKVPKVKGDRENKAKAALRHANCAVGKVTKGKTLTVPKGRVFSTRPKYGTIDKTGTKVAIKISSGKPRCRVPRLKGDTLSKAKKALRRTSCSLGKVTRRKSSRVPKGKVISSSPNSRRSHKPGTKVALTISRGRH